MARFLRTIPILVTLAVMIPAAPHAEWVTNGNVVTTADLTQSLRVAVLDGFGGAVFAWTDNRNGNEDVYAQRIDAGGVPLWAVDGVAVCTATGSQFPNSLLPDGTGGAFVAWQDWRDPVVNGRDIYAQRLDAAGASVWAANGLPIATVPLAQLDPEMAPDGSGGVIIVWADERNAVGDLDVYAQRVDSLGAIPWAANGVTVITFGQDQHTPKAVPDGAGGAIIVWIDDFSGNDDLFAQRLDATGNRQWPPSGAFVTAATDDQSAHQLVADGAGGVIVTWTDGRTGTELDIYAQKLDSTGDDLWATDGVAICTATDDQIAPRIVSDGSGGAVISWTDNRGGADSDVYARRVNASGKGQWQINGIVVCDTTGNQQVSKLASDGAGGAIVAWEDERAGNYDVYAQRLDSNGMALWRSNGVGVIKAAYLQGAVELAEDGTGGVIAGWTDYRLGDADIFAQRIEPRYGEWGRPEPRLYSVSDVPADQGGLVSVDWLASDRDKLGMNLITHYSIWRATSVAPVAEGVEGKHVLLSDVGPDFAGPAIFIDHTTGTDYFWEWIANQDAMQFPSYSYTAATRFDSVGSDPAIHYFRVVAHTSNQFVHWASNVDSGYSVDNLPPGAPLVLAAVRAGGSDVDLDWSPSGMNEPDFKEYRLYRGEISGFPSDADHFLLATTDTVATDSAADPGTVYYYKVVAVDVHYNRSQDSNEAMVDAVTAVTDRAPAITQLIALANEPNPFNASTELRIGLPVASRVTLEVYDVAGRQVYRQTWPWMLEGWRRVVFEGRDNTGHLLPSGVYFYRVSAAGTMTSRKMVIRR